MPNSITLQLLDLQITSCMKQDLQKKLDIALNIVKKISEENEDLDKLDHIASLTGVSSETLKKLNEFESTSRRFGDWVLEQDLTEYDNRIYNQFKSLLLISYTEHHIIPTKQSLTATLSKIKQNRNSDFQIHRHFTRFFTYIKLPRSQASIIVEKPEIVMQRRQYLRMKLMYQESGKNVVYIDGITLTKKRGMFWVNRSFSDDIKKRFVIAVSPQCGYLGSIYCYGTDEKPFLLWIVDKLIPQVPPGTVFILQGHMLGTMSEPPSMNSSKQDMINWLQDNDIPHDPNNHRADLFALIEKYKETRCGKTSTIEDMLRGQGHMFLNRTKSIDFNYLEHFWLKLVKTLSREKGKRSSQIPFRAKEIANTLGPEYWKASERALSKVERNAYMDDLKMEDVIDKLMTMTKLEGLPVTNERLDTYCKAMNEEYIFSL